MTEKASVATAGFATVGAVSETANLSFLAKEIAAVAAAAVVISATAETVNAVVPRDSAGISVAVISAAEVFADCVP